MLPTSVGGITDLLGLKLLASINAGEDDAMVKTNEEVVALVMENNPEAPEDVVREDIEAFAPLPEGYSRINPYDFDFSKLPMEAYSYPPLIDGEPAIALTVGKAYLLEEADPFVRMVFGGVIEFTADDGSDATSPLEAMFGWAVKDEQ